MHGAKAIKDKPAAAKKGGVHASNLVRLDSRHPIPLESGRAFSFVNNVSYLPFFPPKDTFAKDLIEARLLSTTHNACIITKKDFCAGAGMADADGRDLPPEMVDWFKSMNLHNDPVLEINRKILEDLFTLGNAPIMLVRFTVAASPKLYIYPQNMNEWRLCKPNEDDVVTEAVQSKLFLRETTGFVTAEQLKSGRKLPIFNPLRTDKENWVRENGAERTLLWYKNGMTGIPYYGLPSAISSLIYQILEYKGARFNLDMFENEMVPASILALKGQLTQTEADRLSKKVINTYTGDGTRGRTIVLASEQGIDGSDLHKLETKREGSYTEADDLWSQKIILANQWDAVLAGILSPSTLGKGSGFVTKILENKFNTVIKPAQRDLMVNVWAPIFQIAEAWMRLPFSKFDVQIENEIDISGLTDVDITEAVQVNEVRKAKGLPEDPSKEGVYMKGPGAAAPLDPQPGASGPSNQPGPQGSLGPSGPSQGGPPNV